MYIYVLFCISRYWRPIDVAHLLQFEWKRVELKSLKLQLRTQPGKLLQFHFSMMGIHWFLYRISYSDYRGIIQLLTTPPPQEKSTPLRLHAYITWIGSQRRLGKSCYLTVNVYELSQLSSFLFLTIKRTRSYSTYQKFGNAREKLIQKADFRGVPKNPFFHGGQPNFFWKQP